MDQQNQTVPDQNLEKVFIIKGISDVPELQLPIFLLVLLIYFLSLSGNMTILVLVCLDHHLHTPMYFFLANLSIVDMSFATVSLHNILLKGLSRNRVISHPSCITQMYFVGSFISDELLILTAMSYDRYVAICNPMRYTVIMNRRLCVRLASVCWILGFIEIIPYAILLAGFSCYRSNIVNHIFCDLVPVLQLSCDDTSVLETLFMVEGVLVLGLGPFLLTALSYIFIITTILRISSSTGRRKTFYTCSSHLTVVLLLYTTLICQYLRPISADTIESNKLFSLFNSAAVPILNPFIYSLKNKDVKLSLKKRLNLFRDQNQQ